jgi:hypothetical protein
LGIEMKDSSSPKSNSRKPSLRGKVLIAMAFVAMSSNVNAFSDGPALVQRLVVMGKEIAEYQQQLRKMQEQYDNLQKNLAKLEGLTNVQMPVTDNLEERDINYHMDLYCPGAPKGVLSSLKGALSINPGGNIKEQQMKVCQHMVMAKNAQYNEAAKVLKLLKERNKELKKIEDRRATAIAGGGKPGDIDAINLDFQQLATRMDVDANYSNTVIGAYGAYYSALESTQTQLGKSGMTGDTGNKTFATQLVSKFVQGAALEAGLQAARTRDR